MDWLAIVWSGFVASTLAAAFFWVFRSLGWSSFAPSLQLGCVFLRDPRHPATETLGFLLYLLLGSTLIPALYAALMAGWMGPSWSTGAVFGVLHGIAILALLPATGTISACIRAGTLRPPGRLGLGWGKATPFGVVLGHTLYGGIVGAVLAGFYGP